MRAVAKPRHVDSRYERAAFVIRKRPLAKKRRNSMHTKKNCIVRRKSSLKITRIMTEKSRNLRDARNLFKGVRVGSRSYAPPPARSAAAAAVAVAMAMSVKTRD